MMESSSGKTDDARLLVMGYRGTLRPELCQKLPPAMESLLEPWLAQASQRLNQRVCQQQRVFQGEPVPLDALFPLLKDTLIGILTQAVGVSGFASGEPTASDIFGEFPLLQPLIRGAVCEWVEAIGTFLQRLHRDQSWLAASLRLVTLPPIQSISGAASDMHAGGHLVLRVCFQGGGCLYYKPRPLTGEWLWQRLLDAIARLDPQLHLPASRVLPSDATSRYGWAESVLPDENRFSVVSDTTPSATVDYWHAAGAMLCLAQHVRLTDLHLGNIIATPSGPAVTDAECLATPIVHQLPAKKASQQPEVTSHILEAILDTGLLPRKQDSPCRMSRVYLDTLRPSRASRYLGGRCHPTDTIS